MTNETEALAVIDGNSQGIGPVLPLVSPQAMAEAMQTYEALKKAVLGENDEQEITVKGKKRKFTKRSGWRRLSIAFGVSTTILDRKITAGPDGRTVSAEFTVRATAPNGRFADGWGACSAWEERFQDDRGRGKMEHDIPATAETRAENRAASNLFGYGELSAEEVEDSPGVARPTCPKCGKVVRESTFNEGEWFCWQKQGGCGWKGTEPIRTDTEIPEAQASKETLAALKGAQGEGTSPASPSAPTIGTAQVGASGPSPSSGPRAKRTNVVKAPQGAPSPGGTAAASRAPAAASAPPVALIDDEDGKDEYLASLRELAREAAASLQSLRVKLKNKRNAEAIDLGTAVPLEDVPPTPNPGSDAALAAFINTTLPGKKLAELGADELDGSDEAPGILRTLDALVKRVTAELAK